MDQRRSSRHADAGRRGVPRGVGLLSSTAGRHAAQHRADPGREAAGRASRSLRTTRAIVWALLAISLLGYLLLALPPAIGTARAITATRRAQEYETAMLAGVGEKGFSPARLASLRSRVASYDRQMRSFSVSDPFTPHPIAPSADYTRLIASMPDGAVGTLRIPSIGLERRIDVGGDPTQIQGIEHLPQTALPSAVDGINTVLAGHNGQTDDPAFDDLDKVRTGQQFMIDTLGQELVYTVDKITTVRPTDISGVRAYKGRRYATLMTCTPRYINSFRLLVRGSLTQVRNLDSTTAAMTSPAADSSWWPVTACLAVAAAYACAVIALVRNLLIDPAEETLIVADLTGDGKGAPCGIPKEMTGEKEADDGR